jgi:hypothetical protein
VPILGDVAQEADETFVLNLSAVSGAVVADAQAAGTIQNDDVPAAGGLVAAYSFEENTGTTTADKSGKGHTGTLTGVDWADDGKNGLGLWFPGVNNWVTIADANDLDLTNGMTLEAWVNPFSLSGWNTVMMKEAGGAFAYGLYANDGSPWPAVTLQIGGADRTAAGTAALPLNTWSHLAATYDGATLRLYRNGVQIGSRAQTGNILTSTGALRIGGNAIWGEYFRGLIDDVRIYNRALSAAEIQSDMNTPVQ